MPFPAEIQLALEKYEQNKTSDYTSQGIENLKRLPEEQRGDLFAIYMCFIKPEFIRPKIAQADRRARASIHKDELTVFEVVDKLVFESKTSNVIRFGHDPYLFSTVDQFGSPLPEQAVSTCEDFVHVYNPQIFEELVGLASSQQLTRAVFDVVRAEAKPLCATGRLLSDGEYTILTLHKKNLLTEKNIRGLLKINGVTNIKQIIKLHNYKPKLVTEEISEVLREVNPLDAGSLCSALITLDRENCLTSETWELILNHRRSFPDEYSVRMDGFLELIISLVTTARLSEEMKKHVTGLSDTACQTISDRMMRIEELVDKVSDEEMRTIICNIDQDEYFDRLRFLSENDLFPQINLSLLRENPGVIDLLKSLDANGIPIEANLEAILSCSDIKFPVHSDNRFYRDNIRALYEIIGGNIPKLLDCLHTIELALQGGSNLQRKLSCQGSILDDSKNRSKIIKVIVLNILGHADLTNLSDRDIETTDSLVNHTKLTEAEVREILMTKDETEDESLFDAIKVYVTGDFGEYQPFLPNPGFINSFLKSRGLKEEEKREILTALHTDLQAVRAHDLASIPELRALCDNPRSRFGASPSFLGIAPRIAFFVSQGGLMTPEEGDDAINSVCWGK